MKYTAKFTPKGLPNKHKYNSWLSSPQKAVSVVSVKINGGLRKKTIKPARKDVDLEYCWSFPYLICPVRIYKFGVKLVLAHGLAAV